MKNKNILIVLGIVALIAFLLFFKSAGTFSVSNPNNYTCPNSINECNTCDKFVWTVDSWRYGTCSMAQSNYCLTAFSNSTYSQVIANNLMMQLDSSTGNYSSTATGTMSCIDQCTTCEYTKKVANNALYSSTSIRSCINKINTIPSEASKLKQYSNGTYYCFYPTCDKCEQLIPLVSSNLTAYNMCKYSLNISFPSEYARWNITSFSCSSAEAPDAINFFTQEVFQINGCSVKLWMILAVVGGILLLLIFK